MDGVILNEYFVKFWFVLGKGEVYMGGVNGLFCIDNCFLVIFFNYLEVVLIDVCVNGELVMNWMVGNFDKFILL